MVITFDRFVRRLTLTVIWIKLWENLENLEFGKIFQKMSIFSEIFDNRDFNFFEKCRLGWKLLKIFRKISILVGIFENSRLH